MPQAQNPSPLVRVDIIHFFVHNLVVQRTNSITILDNRKNVGGL